MRKVYATTPGAEIRIGNLGTATNDQPCLVPAAVAEQLVGVEGLRVEPDDPAPKKKHAPPVTTAPEKE